MASAPKTISPRQSFKVCTATPRQFLSSWEDLEKAGYPKSKFDERLSEMYCAKVDRVFVNEEMCLDQGHHCHTIQDVCSYGNQNWATVMATGDSKELMNNTDKPLTLNVQLKSTQTRRAAATVTKACDFSLRNRINVSSSELGIQGMVPTSFQLENSVGSTCSRSEDVEISRNVEVTLQPGQRAVAILDITWIELRQDFEIPFTIDGWCMSTFRDMVNGQRNWLHDIGSIVETPKSSISGTIECVYDIQGSPLVTLM